ncbi:MAG TPA: membrane protein insertase YidC [Gemmatimonadaceae bacterium]|nr:membrane protein insertase YidC [Gemmatimonadaceae bacterium]
MDKRFFLALFLSLVVIALSQLLFPPPKPVPSSQRPVGVSDSAAKANVTASSSTEGLGRSSTPAPSAGGTASRPPAANETVAAGNSTAAETTSVITPKATYNFSNIGAAPVSVVLHDYKNRSATGGPVMFGGSGGPLLGYKLITPTDTVDLSKAIFVPTRTKSPNGDEQLTYNATAGSHKASITYRITSDTSTSYLVRVDGQISGVQPPAYLITELPKTIQATEADTISDHRTLAYSFKPQKDHSRSVLFGSLDPGEKTLEAGPLNWIALKNKYFVFGILSLPNSTPFSEVTLTGGPRTSKVATSASASVVQETRNGSFSYEIYAGPQESQRLARVGRDFDHVNPYGWRFLQGVVHPIASKVIQALLWMHNRLNLTYGWVLVILGVLVRLALWPLNQSTMRSSLKMQELQPKLAAAQKKYKDPVQQREAIMKVYHDAGVSPFAGLTGCLPALLPMPILFALFFVFQNTIEFRGVPFMWLHDISVKDPFYILPLLMGASMYVLSWIGMRNAPPNPQAKMMGYMFPVMMTVVLLNMASGLNLYYTAQNIAALPQQWMLARERARARPAG